MIASPVAVLPAALTDCSASRTASWSRVGDCSTSAFWLKATAPTLTLSGIASRNVAAAFLAAASRLGETSVGEHRAGAVGHDHHARLLGGDGDRGLRLGERDEQRGDRDAVADDRGVAPPAGAPRRDRGQQVRGRERLRAPLGAHVEDERDRDQREADQVEGAGEAHRLQRLPSRAGPSSARLTQRDAGAGRPAGRRAGGVAGGGGRRARRRGASAGPRSGAGRGARFLRRPQQRGGGAHGDREEQRERAGVPRRDHARTAARRPRRGTRCSAARGTAGRGARRPASSAHSAARATAVKARSAIATGREARATSCMNALMSGSRRSCSAPWGGRHRRCPPSASAAAAGSRRPAPPPVAAAAVGAPKPGPPSVAIAARVPKPGSAVGIGIGVGRQRLGGLDRRRGRRGGRGHGGVGLRGAARGAEQQEDEEGGDGRGAHPAVRAAAVCLVHALQAGRPS